MALNPQIVGNVGLYFACYHLSLLGWNVMPTARNARGVDVIAYNLLGTRFIGIQVKTLSKRNPVPLGSSLEKLMGDYWIIINRAVSELHFRRTCIVDGLILPRKKPSEIL
jgi:hypothetical protein